MSASIAQAVRAAAGAGADLETSPYADCGLEPAAVVAPASADAAAAVLDLCSREGWPVLPCGNGTRPDAARAAISRASPQRAVVLVSTARLTDVVEHEPSDLVVGVQAGVTHTRLAQTLASAAQELALDPPVLTASTIGASVALDAAGPLRAANGSARDAVLGVEIVAADGRVLRFGGRVVKNVAGYDAVRLITGSAGSLGLVTSVFLRLRGRPLADRTLAYTGADAATAAELALGIRDAVGCDALELLSPRLARDLGLQMKWTVLARVRGGPDAVADAASRIGAVAGAGEETPATVWQQLCRTEAAARDRFSAVAPPASLRELVERLSDAEALAVHAADGIARGWGAPPELRERVLASGWVWRSAGMRPERPGADGRAVDLERQLQRLFDPAGILIPRHAVLP